MHALLPYLDTQGRAYGPSDVKRYDLVVDGQYCKGVTYDDGALNDAKAKATLAIWIGVNSLGPSDEDG